VKIFFPFLEGALEYDCNDCTAPCCFGSNLIMTKREWGRLSKASPSLKYLVKSKFANTKRDFFITATNLSYCCFFDRERKICSIQKKRGYELKPLACRAEPFYVLKCGDVGVVSLTTQSCFKTLSVVRNFGPNNTTKEQMRIIEASVRESMGAGYFTGEIHWTKGRLALEREILQESEPRLASHNYLEFATTQMQMVYKNVSPANIREELLRKITLWQRFFKAEDMDLDDRLTTYILTALTSVLRVREYHINERVAPFLLSSLYFLSVLRGAKNNTTTTADKMVVSYYEQGLAFAKKLLFLTDDRRTRVKLLSYADRNRGRASALARNSSITELADKFELPIEDRMLFVSSLG